MPTPPAPRPLWTQITLGIVVAVLLLCGTAFMISVGCPFLFGFGRGLLFGTR